MYDMFFPVPVPVAASTQAIASAVPSTTRRVTSTKTTVAMTLDHLTQSSPEITSNRDRPRRPVRTGSRKARVKAVT